MDVEVLIDILDLLLVAQIQHVFHHHGPKHDPRFDVRRARLVVVELV